MLNINGITVRLGGRTILDRATAALPGQARVGLIGRNGAGKSTLMKVMIGALEADDGVLDMPQAAPASAISRRKLRRVMQRRSTPCWQQTPNVRL